MDQEAAQELIDRQSQESLLVFVSGISPAKRNLVIDERDETVTGDRHAVCVGAEVAKHLLGSAEGWLAVDHPSQREKLADQTPEQPGLSQAAKPAVELELSGSVSLLERFEKLAAEDFAENRFGEKEAVIVGAHPVRVIARQAAGGDDAVNVRMMASALTIP